MSTGRLARKRCTVRLTARNGRRQLLAAGTLILMTGIEQTAAQSLETSALNWPYLGSILGLLLLLALLVAYYLLAGKSWLMGDAGMTGKTLSPFDSAVVRDAREGIIVYGLDLRYLAWNPQMEVLTGRLATEVLGRHPLEVFPYLNVFGVVARLEAALGGNVPAPAETLFEFRGRSGWVSETISPIRDAAGAVVALMVSFHDISQLKHMEQALRESASRLEYLISSAPGSLYTAMATDKLSASFVSTNVYAQFGYAPREITDNPDFWVQHLHPDDAAAVIDELARLFERDQHLQEYRFLHRDGSYRWVRDRRQLRRLADGTPHEIVGFRTDITHSKRVENTLLFLADTDATASEGFFRPLARYLASALDAEYVSVSRLLGDGHSSETLAVFVDGHFAANTVQQLEDTPCADVVGQQIRIIKSGVRTLFPQVAALTELRAESYMGTPLWSHAGQSIGLIMAVGRRPLIDSVTPETILRSVAVRAAGELERMIAQRALRNSEVKFARAFNDAPLMMTLSDWRNGTLLEVNNRHLELTGYRREELIGQPLHTLGCVSDDDRARMVEKLRAEGGFRDQELIILGKDRKPTQSLVSCVILDLEDRRCLLALALDISARKQAEFDLRASVEELRQRNDELDRFNRAMVNRELRVIELKQLVNQLHARLQEPPRFTIPDDLGNQTASATDEDHR